MAIQGVLLVAFCAWTCSGVAPPPAIRSGGWEQAAGQRQVTWTPEDFIFKYAGPFAPRIQNATYSGDGFGPTYAEAGAPFAHEEERLDKEFASAPRRARDCHTIKSLGDWHDSQLARIRAFVPKVFRSLAEGSLQEEFERNSARVRAEERAAARATAVGKARSGVEHTAAARTPPADEPAATAPAVPAAPEVLVSKPFSFAYLVIFIRVDRPEKFIDVQSVI